MRFLLGLTGSIGMGKSTTAQIFVEHGCKLWDADQAVHKAYATGGAAVLPIQKHFPDAIVDGAVSRAKLKDILSAAPHRIPELEAIVHPIVTADRQRFISGHEEGVLVFDIPLLFETNSETQFDATACVATSPENQKTRVMARGGMTEHMFELILSKQMPSSEKQQKADYVICTDTHSTAKRDVMSILDQIGAKP